MTRSYRLTDCEWSILSPVLPNKLRGVPGSMIDVKRAGFAGG